MKTEEPMSLEGSSGLATCQSSAPQVGEATMALLGRCLVSHARDFLVMTPWVVQTLPDFGVASWAILSG